MAIIFFWFACLCYAGLDQPCNGWSDNCSGNPDSDHQDSPFNYHPTTCNLKWQKCSGEGSKQKPSPYKLCNTKGDPSGQIPVDWYTLAVQKSGDNSFTLHGMWPSSQYAKGSKNQPYGCLNGEEFNEDYLNTFSDLFNTFWPTDPKFGNTMECFIMSEWMKHGTCAVIPGGDGNAFRITQEFYYRTAMVLLNEYNLNAGFRQSLDGDEELEPVINVNCIQCAYFSALGWKDNDPSNVPRISSDCIKQCYACGNENTCTAANLDSTVGYDSKNAPQPADSNRIELK